MRKVMCHIAVCGVVLFAVVGFTSCGGGRSDDVVARVANDPITREELAHWQSAQADASDRTKQRVLGFLISSQWTIGEAAEVGVKVTDAEAQKQLELVKYDQLERIKYEQFPLAGELQRSFAGAGVTRSDRLWLMRLGMLVARLEQARHAQAQRSVAHAQIVEYYNEHRRRFVRPERRDLEWIVTYSKATLRNAVREVQSGKSFLSVAERVSLDPATIRGLELASAQEKTFAEHIFAARPHVLTGPLRQAHNYYMFRVTKVTPSRPLTLAQSEVSVRQQLATQQQRQASVGLAEAFARKWTARTRCSAGYVVPRCREYASRAGVASGSPYLEAIGTTTR